MRDELGGQRRGDARVGPAAIHGTCNRAVCVRILRIAGAVYWIRRQISVACQVAESASSVSVSPENRY